MMKTQELRRIGRFALFGAVGFGIGGLILDVGPVPGMIGSPIMGALGGAALGLALRRRAIALGLTGAIGLLVGILAVLPLALDEHRPFGGDWDGVFFGAIMGTILGAALGLALWDWRKIMGLALAGAIGFGIGFGIGFAIFMSAIDMTIIGLLSGIIGGAFLGAALGYLERGRQTSA